MRDIFTTTEPAGEEEEEFGSLFESFQNREELVAEEEVSGDRLGVFRRLFSSVTGRKRVARISGELAPAAEVESDTGVATGADMDLSSPLDLDSARRDMLRPEAVAPPVPERPQKKSRSGSSNRLGLSQIQLLVLGGLLVLVLAVYGLLAVVMLRGRAEWAAVPATEGVVLASPSAAGETVAGEELLFTTTPFAEGEDEAVVDATPLPLATATPQPATATSLDLQVMQDPNNLDLRLERGAEYLRLGDHAAALRDFEHAEGLDKERAEAYLGQGRAYIFLRRWKEAEAALGTAVSFNAELEAAHFWLGRLFFYAGRYAEAAGEFDWAAELNHEEPLYEAWLARAAAQDGNLEEAQGAVGRVFSVTEKLPLGYLSRAEVRILEEDYEAAQGDLLYAKSLAVHDFEILNSLARFYLEYMPERRGDAELLAQQAQNWALWDIEEALALQTLGRIRLAQGRQAEAKQLFAQASALATVDGQVGLPGLLADIDALLRE